MAKKKTGSSPAGRPKGDNPPAGNVLVLKGRKEWRDWVHRLAASQRTKVPQLVDQLLVAEARRLGFEPPPPRL